MADLTYQVVTGKWTYVVADGFGRLADPDTDPDEVLPTGRVEFTPRIGGNVSLLTGSPTRSVSLAAVPGLVADGVLCDLNGVLGVRLATKVGENPVYWTARPALEYGKTTIPAKSIEFGPTADTTQPIHLNDLQGATDEYPAPVVGQAQAAAAQAGQSANAAAGSATAANASRIAAQAAAAAAGAADEFFHSMAGATTGMALPAVSNSGHPLTWTRMPANVGSTGKINGRGGFWTDPAVAPSAVYMTATLKAKPRWGWVRAAFLPQTTGNGTVCLAVPSKASITGVLTMALHARSTSTGWAVTVWDNGEQLIEQGVYSPPLIADPNRPYEIELAYRHIDDDTIQIRMADGVVREYSDPRFASLGGPHIFAESYDPATTDAVVAVMDVRGGDRPPSWLFTSPSSGDLLQQLAYRVRTVNGQAPDGSGNVTVAAGGGAPADNSITTAKLVDDNVTTAKLAATIRASLAKADAAAPQAATTTALGKKADLDANGVLLQSQLPAQAMTDFLGAVGSQAAMLALTGQRGDWCTRTDRGTDWQLINEPSTALASWREKTYPASPVSSVNGRVGAVTTSSDDLVDSGAVGRSVVRAADQATARTAIGAGTSSLTLGTTGATAAAGNDARIVAGGTAAQPADIAAAQLVPINAQAAAYQLVVADQNKAVEVTAAAGVAVTVPTNATAAFPIGAVVEIVQTGAGQITITPAAGVTINSSASLVTRTQWSSVVLRKRAADTWVLAGDTQ